MASWRVAHSLETLREQVNALAPERSRADDGTIASDEHHHQNPKSDHEADRDGIVHAMDLTHDPRGGFDSYQFADMLISPGHRDPRIKYVISNRRIAGDEAYARRNGATPWVWAPYHGKNPHDHHVHVSVNAENGDDPGPWNIGLAPPAPDAPVVQPKPTVRLGSKGENVRYLQTLLGLKTDGDFGPLTEAAVKAFQKAHGLVPDGVVGRHTWDTLIANPGPPEPLGGAVQKGITATVFGGSSEIERSAYDAHRIGEQEFTVALPWRFVGPRPHVKVTNTANGKSAVASIEDVGPWMVDDPYWLSGDRPMAETYHDAHRKLPRGPNAGRVPANRAGIDLSPALGRTLGITLEQGSGIVDWELI